MIKKKITMLATMLMVVLGMASVAYGQENMPVAYDTNDSTPLFWVILVGAIAVIIALVIIITAIVKKKKKG